MYVFDVNSPAWEILGGFGLFLFGIRYLSETLQRVAGAKFKRALDRAASTRFSSLLAGTLLTSILKSETITAILTITFVNSGLLSLYQALAILLGTTIGTSVAVHLAGSFHYPVTFIFILLGVTAKYLSRNRRIVATGEVFLGIGFITLGLGIVEAGFLQIINRLASSGLVGYLNSSPFVVFVAGILITLLLQSGRATLAIIVTLAQGQVLSGESVYTMLAGELLGIPLMAMIAAMLGTPVARITAALFLGINTIGAVVVLTCSSAVDRLLQGITFNIAGQLVIAHTLISAGLALIFLPLLGPITRWVMSWSRSRKNALDLEARPSYLDHRVLSTPGIALILVRDEMQRMATVCRSMLRDIESLLYRYDSRKVMHIHQQEDVMDALQREITEFLARLAPSLVDTESRFEVPRMLSTVNALELAADNIASMLKALEQKKLQKTHFSQAAINDLKMLVDALAEICDLLLTNWQDLGAISEEQLLEQQRSIRELVSEAMESHLQRLAEGKCTVRGALVYNDLLEACARFMGNVTTVYKTNRNSPNA